MEQQKISPIKRHPALVSYSKEHHKGLMLVWKIRAGKRKQVEDSRIGAYLLHSFEHDLEIHFADEENYLCPLLPPDDVRILQLLKEHIELRKLVKEISNQPDNGELIARFANLLEAHIRFEERRFFNHLQNCLSEGQLNDLASIERGTGADCDLLWKDKFWL
jgi:hemerythrin